MSFEISIKSNIITVTFGFCMKCGKKIPQVRLKIL